MLQSFRVSIFRNFSLHLLWCNLMIFAPSMFLISWAMWNCGLPVLRLYCPIFSLVIWFLRLVPFCVSRGCSFFVVIRRVNSRCQFLSRTPSLAICRVQNVWPFNCFDATAQIEITYRRKWSWLIFLLVNFLLIQFRVLSSNVIMNRFVRCYPFVTL